MLRKTKELKKWYVYLLMCSDKTLYCGITTNVSRRIFEHNNTKRGAKYTRGRRPVKLIGTLEKNNRSEATITEIKIKKLKKEEKIAVFLK